jgi:hypothetical protein
MQSYAVLWDRDPAALRFLHELHAEVTPRIEKILALRRTMAEWQDQRYDKDFKAKWKTMTEENESLTGGPER